MSAVRPPEGVGRRFERPVLVDQIAAEIRDDILRGRMQPGETINVVALSKRLGVSHIPVREALRKLASEALIETRPYQSAVVAGVELEELHEIYDLRRIIEGELVERAAAAYTADDLGLITESLERLSATDPSSPDGGFWEAHRQFHRAVMRPALVPWSERVLNLLWQSSERYQRLFTLVFGSASAADDDHRSLAAATQDGSPDEVRSVLIAHLRSTERTVTEGYLASLHD